jgi:MFS family permease
MSSLNPKHDPFAALRIKEFLFFLNTRFFLTIAIQMQSMLVGWQIYKETGDYLAMGIIGLTEAIPNIVTCLFSGHIADSFNRKRILVIFVSLFLICSVLLFYFSRDNSSFIKEYGTFPIYLVIGLTGVIRGFLSPTFPSFMSQLVPREQYVNSATWNSTVWHVAAIAGPVIAGFICASSFAAAYAVNFVLVFIAIISLLFIKAKPLPAKDKQESLFSSLSAGLHFVFKNQLILGALSLDLFAVLFGGAVAMLPAYADKVLHVTGVELGFLRAAPAFGAVIMALIIAYKPPKHNAGRNLFIAIACFGVATICFALSTNFYLSLFFLVLTGAFDNVSVVIRHTILQLSTPDNMRGRVSAVNNIFIGSSNEIGEFESGIAAHAMGLKTSVVFGGVMTLLVVAVTARIAPKLRRLDIKKIE